MWLEPKTAVRLRSRCRALPHRSMNVTNQSHGSELVDPSGLAISYHGQGQPMPDATITHVEYDISSKAIQRALPGS